MPHRPQARPAIVIAIVAVSLLLSATALPAPAGAALLFRDSQSYEVSAYGGTVAWSKYSRAEERFRLVEHVGGRTFDAPLRPSREIFDLDLGPSPIGGPVAVFPRCGGYRHDYDCDIRALDLTQASGYAVSHAGSAKCVESAPSVWGRAVAFARRPSPPGPECRRGLFVAGPRGLERVARRAPLGTDLMGDLLAAAFVSGGGHEGRPGRTRSAIVLFDLSTGERRTVAAGLLDRRARGSFLTAPVLDGGTLYYISHEQPGPSRVIGQRVAAGGRDVITGDLTLDSLGVDGGRIYYTSARGVHVLR